jgi:hemerythrin superfamily protein
MQEAGLAQPTAGTDVVDELTRDHREVTALLDELLETNDPETRRDMVDAAATELVRHSVAEEMYVYPAMRDHLPERREGGRARRRGAQGARAHDESA